MLGVDYDLFWTLNPKSLAPFVKAFELKQNYDDRLAWQFGAYIRYSIASTLSKGAKYPQQPFSEQGKSRDMTPDEIKERMMANVEIINMRIEQREGLLNG